MSPRHARTWFSKYSPQRLDVERDRTKRGRLCLILAFGRLATREASAPFELLLGSACRQNHLVQLVVADEHNLPRIRGRVALEPCTYPLTPTSKRNMNEARRLTPTVVHLFHLDVVQGDTRLDRIYLVSPACCRETQPLFVEQGDHVLPTDALLGLPTYMERPAKLDMPKRPDAILQSGVELLLRISTCPAREVVGRTWFGNTRRSCKIHVFSNTDLTRTSSVALLISAVASRSLINVFSISMFE